ncbi:MAG: SH3 domain-containing protein [Hyphomicrobiales bacterium]
MSRRKTLPALLSATLIGLALTSVVLVRGHHGGVATEEGEVTGAISKAQAMGATGLPIPRFVTLKADKVNVRKGPSSDHDVAFMFQRKGLPVEITAEFENWRKVRDSDGEEGWILQSMLAGRRNAYVAYWANRKFVGLYAGADKASGLLANMAPGVLASIKSCNGHWCEIEVDGRDGYAMQSQLWGVYPGEVVD